MNEHIIFQAKGDFSSTFAVRHLLLSCDPNAAQKNEENLITGIEVFFSSFTFL